MKMREYKITAQWLKAGTKGFPLIGERIKILGLRRKAYKSGAWIIETEKTKKYLLENLREYNTKDCRVVVEKV